MDENPNDEIREEILRYFYDRNAHARGVRGKTGSQIKISDVKRQLKELHGLSQAQVISNLTYLLERGWVTHHEEKKVFTTSRGTAQPSIVDWYGISADGIDKIEGDTSSFKAKTPFAGINVTAIGSMVQVGDGNIVNVEFAGAREDLVALEAELSGSPSISDSEKIAVIADIETVKNQLAKPEPDKSIVQRAWSGIEKVATSAGLAANLLAIGAKLVGLL